MLSSLEGFQYLPPSSTHNQIELNAVARNIGHGLLSRVGIEWSLHITLIHNLKRPRTVYLVCILMLKWFLAGPPSTKALQGFGIDCYLWPFGFGFTHSGFPGLRYRRQHHLLTALYNRVQGPWKECPSQT